MLKTIVASALVVVGVSGCEGGRAVLSEEHVVGHATLQEQQAWAAAEAQAVIRITKTEGLWKDLLTPDLRWDADQRTILDSADRASCTFKAGEVNPAALELDLRTDPLDTDPFELMEQIRGLWISEGWEVVDVFTRGDTAAADSAEIRADRKDGAGLGLEAFDDVGSKRLVLSVQAACSDDSSVAW